MSSASTIRSVIAVVLLCGLSQAAESPQKRGFASYSTRILELELPEAGRAFRDVRYANGNLWVYPDSGAADTGEIWRFDSSGKAERFTLPVVERSAKLLWAEGASVYVAQPGEIFRLSSSGNVASLVATDKNSPFTYPMREGYVSFARDGEVTWRLGEDSLPLVKSKCESVADPKKGGEPEAIGRDYLRGRSSRRPYLIRESADAVLYVEPNPYRFWRLTLDGSTRCASIDESLAPVPVGPDWPGRKTLSVGERRIMGGGVRAGALVLSTLYRTELEVTAVSETNPLRLGERMMTYMGFIDVVDLETGEIRERVNVDGLKNPGTWAGFHGDDGLAFFNMEAGSKPYLSIATPSR